VAPVTRRSDDARLQAKVVKPSELDRLDDNDAKGVLRIVRADPEWGWGPDGTAARQLAQWQMAHPGALLTVVGDPERFGAIEWSVLASRLGRVGISVHPLPRTERLNDDQIAEAVRAWFADFFVDGPAATRGATYLSSTPASGSSSTPGSRASPGGTGVGGGVPTAYDDPPLRLSDDSYLEWLRRLGEDPDERGD
jgi:hypothetical protein